MKTINIELSPQGIKSALRELDKYINDIPSKLQTLAERLATEVGVNVVLVHYLNGADEGNVDYDVVVVPTKNGCKLVAQGEDVCFLEFGAGVTTEGYQGEGQEGLPPIEPGSWSGSYEGLGQFANQGYWFHKGKRYTGLPSTKGLYYANIEMQKQAIEVAKKVFNND